MGAPSAPTLPKLPPAAPDPADAAIRSAAAGERRRQASASSRQKSFLTGLLGDGPITSDPKKLLGT